MAPPLITVLVLGAGKGERLGGPKALLMIDDRPLAALHAERRPANAEVVLVLRAEVARVLGPIPGAVVVESTERDELGPAGSIHAAVRAGVLDRSDLILITPVDVPPAPPERVAPLLDALSDPARSPYDAARWEHGHPIAIRGEVLRRRYHGETPILRDVLRDLGDRCARLASPDAPSPDEAGADLDTPEDVLRRTGARPRFYG